MDVLGGHPGGSFGSRLFWWTASQFSVCGNSVVLVVCLELPPYGISRGMSSREPKLPTVGFIVHYPVRPELSFCSTKLFLVFTSSMYVNQNMPFEYTKHFSSGCESLYVTIFVKFDWILITSSAIIVFISRENWRIQ